MTVVSFRAVASISSLISCPSLHIICHKELLTLASVCEALSQLLDFTPFFWGAGGDKNLSLIRCSWLPMSCRGLAVLDSPVGISGVPVSRSDLPLSPWGLTFSSAHSF